MSREINGKVIFITYSAAKPDTTDAIFGVLVVEQDTDVAVGTEVILTFPEPEKSCGNCGVTVCYLSTPVPIGCVRWRPREPEPQKPVVPKGAEWYDPVFKTYYRACGDRIQFYRSDGTWQSSVELGLRGAFPCHAAACYALCGCAQENGWQRVGE